MMAAEMDKAIDLLMKVLNTDNNETVDENYNEISDENNFESNETQEVPDVKSIFNIFSENDDKRVTLLSSIKPYMSGKRQEKVDAAIQIVRFISLSSGLGITNLFKQ